MCYNVLLLRLRYYQGTGKWQNRSTGLENLLIYRHHNISLAAPIQGNIVAIAIRGTYLGSYTRSVV